MAKNKSSKFGVSDDFVFSDDTLDNDIKSAVNKAINNTPKEEPVSNTYDNSGFFKDLNDDPEPYEEDVYVSKKNIDDLPLMSHKEVDSLRSKFDSYLTNKASEPKEIGSTQGKKGQKLKRINMAFSDLNYEFIKRESIRKGYTMTEFINHIIDSYKSSHNGDLL